MRILRWDISIKRKTKSMTSNRIEWRKRINVADPEYRHARSVKEKRMIFKSLGNC